MSFPVLKSCVITTTLIASCVFMPIASHASEIVAKKVGVTTSVRTTKAALSKLDCGPVIYDYGSTKETKTVCSMPWTGPESGSASGPVGSSSSTAQ